MKRYSLGIINGPMGRNESAKSGMVLCCNGDWVLYEDVCKEPPWGGTGERSPGPVYSLIQINIKEVTKMVVSEIIKQIRNGEIRIEK